MARPRRRSPRAAVHQVLTGFAKGRVERVAAALDRTAVADEGRGAAFARELALGTVRWQGVLDRVLSAFAHRGLPRDPVVLSALRMGAYQILCMPGVAVHAAVHETVAGLPRMKGLANALLRSLARAVEEREARPAQRRTEVALPGGRCLALPGAGLPDPEAEPAAFLAARYGLPGAMVAGWIRDHGAAAAEHAAAASLATPVVMLRATARAGDRGALAARLAEEGVETGAADHPVVLRWTGGGSPFGTAAYADGWLVAQDPTAVRAAEAVGARPGETVLDLCAAPGTKATLLAEAVGPGGRVLAYDAVPGRRARIAENAARLGLGNLGILETTGDLPPVDRVLVDAPCSNTGVLARRVEVRHRWTPAVVTECVALQEELLRRALAAVRPGGRVVHATCSIEDAENRRVVARVADTGARCVREELILPATPTHDGGGFAVLERPVGVRP